MKKERTKHEKAVIHKAEEFMNAVLEVCQICHAPMFAGVMSAGSDGKPEYDNVIYSAQSHAVKLYDDRIRKHMLVANGFEAVKGPDGCRPEEPADRRPATVKNRPMTIYSLSDIQCGDIEKRMDAFIKFASDNGLCAFVSVAVSNSEYSTVYMTKKHTGTNIPCTGTNQMDRHVLIAEKSFDAVPMRDAVSFDMEEVFGGYE